MREALQPYRGAESLNYLCILMTEMLGDTSLSRVPELLAGFDSVLRTLPEPAATAIRNLRAAGVAPTTKRSLKLMIERYMRYYNVRRTDDVEEDEELPRTARYTIGNDLSLRKMWTDFRPADIDQALTALSTPLAIQRHERMPAFDPEREADIESIDGKFGAKVLPLGFSPPSPPEYELSRQQRPIDPIAWSDLVAMANRFDHIDVESGRQLDGERSWYGRLYEASGAAKAVLLGSTKSGLVPISELILSGIKHLIGLPGAGKTTLLYLLGVLLDERGHKACFLFPSIEVATGFIETLSRYKVQSGLLYGQGDRARNRHVMNFAASLSITNNGFGVTRPIAPYFATNCALAGFSSDEEEAFPHEDPPCLSITQSPTKGSRRRKHSCCLAGVCGRQFAERELANVNIWAGHILSIDRGVAALYVDARIRHFEFIARTFDLLVVDECDGSQSNLDGRGTPLMKLTGDKSALWYTLVTDLHGRAASGSNAFLSGLQIPSILEMTGRFGSASDRLTASITHFDKKFQQRNQNILLTSYSIIADMFPYYGELEDEENSHRQKREACERMWDAASKRVAFRLRREAMEAEDEFLDELKRQSLLEEIEAAATLAKCSVEMMTDFHDQLFSALDQWDRDGDQQSKRLVTAAMERAPGLEVMHADPVFAAYCDLLTTVSMLVLQHFGLAPHLRLMNAEGLVGDEVFESRPSKDQLAILPEALVGRMSGVRYTVSDSGDVNISHVSFDGTPRLLPQRMLALAHETGGSMAVLLTSATSMLEQSPSFHIDEGPHYILKRPNAGAGWANSVYRFLPQIDPDVRTGNIKYLKYSGAKYDNRERALTAMVDQLLSNHPISTVDTAMANNDVVDGMGRKVGFVVNSYDQCELLYQHIIRNHPAWKNRVRRLIKANYEGRSDSHAVTASEVETLGSEREWDLLIFPMNAIGRGVNIVYKFGARQDKAMIGSLFFLTRPHPRADSLQLMQGLVGQVSEQFDKSQFATTEEALIALQVRRRETSASIRQLLRLPLAVQTLGKLAKPFVADLMIIILQTIGRAMRGDCPAFVYFVDQAWAPNSSIGKKDTARTSMLIMMQEILHECLTHSDPTKRECYENLYQTFYQPLQKIEGLNTSSAA